MQADTVEAERFASSIGLLLSDLELERAKHPIQIYFDTNDVTGALLGLEAFYDARTEEFSKELFGRRRVLVRALAAASWLGPIAMLSPHQTELLKLLRLEFGLTPSRHPEERAKQFLMDVGVIREGDDLATRPISKLRGPELKTFVLHQVGRAEPFFKALQAIGGNWQTRLESWRHQSLLKLEHDDVDIMHLVSLPLFQRLYTAFGNHRPYREKDASNFADAATLMILREQLRKFRIAERTAFPCLYATRMFFEVVREAGVQTDFEYRTPGGLVTSALRDSDYFVLRAIFRPHKLRGRRLSYKADSNLLSPEELVQVHAHVLESLELQQPSNSSPAKHDLAYLGRSLVSIVRDLRHLTFFENVWLPFAGESDTNVALRNLEHATKVLNSEPFRQEVEFARRQTQRKLEQNAAVFKSALGLWDHLPPAFQENRFANATTLRSADAFMRNTGLFRFAIRAAIYDRIYEIATPLLLGTPENTTSLRSLIRAFGQARLDIEANRDDAEVAAALLWLVRFDSDVIELLQTTRKRGSLTLDLLYSAAAIRSAETIDTGLTTLSMLERRCAKARSLHARAEISVGIAYLFYHLWLRCADDMRARAAAARRLGRTRGELIAFAIRYAGVGFVALEKRSRAKRAYALNQFLFYTLESGSTDLSVINKAAASLQKHNDDPEVWQYRFDDTMAHYFMRVAELSKTAEDRERALDNATEYAEAARNVAPTDSQVRGTLIRIAQKRAELLTEPA